MGLYRVTNSGLGYGQLIQNVLHFAYPDDVPGEANVTIATSMRDIWLEKQRQFHPAVWTYNLVKVDQLVTGGTGETYTLPVTKVGAGGSDSSAPLMQCAVLQFTTGLAGKKNRGRIFVPITYFATFNGMISTSFLSDRAADINALKTAYVGVSGTAPFYLVVHGRSDAPDEYRTVTNIGLRPTPGCQRRRMIGVGA